MRPAIDKTHDPALRSWVVSANDHEAFPIQNLPIGVFRRDGQAARGGMAIGDSILDLGAVSAAGILPDRAQLACQLCEASTLNEFLALDSESRVEFRNAISEVLSEGASPHPELLHDAKHCEMQLPARIGDYTDFYAGINHALNVGRLFRPDAPLLPNYKWVPIGYHGRSSSIRVSGVPVVRPKGQIKTSGPAPEFGPTQRLDYELELGLWVGRGNKLGEPIAIEQAAESIAGYCLLNDWSARDIQAWEYQPLGPFLAKSFHTTISPWIVTSEALAPFRAQPQARPADDPAPLPYLLDAEDQRRGALDLEMEVLIRTSRMRERGDLPFRLSIGNALDMYWTPAQLVAHHTSNGCDLRSGDLLGTGTISKATPDGYGSLLEITRGGAEQVHLPSGEVRKFLEDGDEVILRATAKRAGFVSIGFGECREVIQPARKRGSD